MTKTTKWGGRPSIELDHVAQRVRAILEKDGEWFVDLLRPVLRLSSNQLVKFYKETQETTKRTAKRHVYRLRDRMVDYHIEKVEKGYRVFYQILAPEEVAKKFGELYEILDRNEKERLRQETLTFKGLAEKGYHDIGELSEKLREMRLEIEDLHWTMDGIKEMARILAERPTSK